MKVSHKPTIDIMSQTKHSRQTIIPEWHYIARMAYFVCRNIHYDKGWLASLPEDVARIIHICQYLLSSKKCSLHTLVNAGVRWCYQVRQTVSARKTQWRNYAESQCSSHSTGGLKGREACNSEEHSLRYYRQSSGGRSWAWQHRRASFIMNLGISW